ncbi:MAG: CHRD domain-containing protein [Alphaproteobacteria bacterium]|nr:CHRD domain-containing protein [Alphaproteobacteria bacterium]MCW5741250.1 CHRD domain-containing protein [Alphaproteobacteria bacterium]
MFSRILIAAAAGLLAAGGMVLAQGGQGPSDRRVTASLTGAKEVPPAQTAGSGTVEGVVNMASRELTWNIKCSGLSGPVTGMHFHGPASEAQNAGVVVPIQGSCAGQGTTGKSVIDQNGLADLIAGKWYVNVHTQRYPNGEIRGQVAVPR